MSNSLFKFSDVEAKNASPSTLREIIKTVLRANDDKCATEMERFLMPPGVAGSREYDHAYAVDLLLKHDLDNGERIHNTMDSTGLSRRMLWDHLVAVYRGVGFQFKHGRLIGILENKSGHADENDTDSVE